MKTKKALSDRMTVGELVRYVNSPKGREEQVRRLKEALDAEQKKTLLANAEAKEEETRICVADIAANLDSRLRFMELAMWNLKEGVTPDGDPLNLLEIADAVSVMAADMRRDVLELYDTK
jgi:hypothetical protein